MSRIRSAGRAVLRALMWFGTWVEDPVSGSIERSDFPMTRAQHPTNMPRLALVRDEPNPGDVPSSATPGGSTDA